MQALKFIFIGMFLIVSNAVMAQATVAIGSPPAWGPVGFSGVRYYYLPDVEAYYDIQSSQFIYYQPTGWVHSSQLPSQYKSYNLFNGYKVVMTGYEGTSPYDHFTAHKKDFKKGSYHGEMQKTNGNPGRNPQGGKGKTKKND